MLDDAPLGVPCVRNGDMMKRLLSVDVDAVRRVHLRDSIAGMVGWAAKRVVTTCDVSVG
jgi:hypothetical protein